MPSPVGSARSTTSSTGATVNTSPNVNSHPAYITLSTGDLEVSFIFNKTYYAWKVMYVRETNHPGYANEGQWVTVMRLEIYHDPLHRSMYSSCFFTLPFEYDYIPKSETWEANKFVMTFGKK